MTKIKILKTSRNETVKIVTKTTKPIQQMRKTHVRHISIKHGIEERRSDGRWEWWWKWRTDMFGEMWKCGRLTLGRLDKAWCRHDTNRFLNEWIIDWLYGRFKHGTWRLLPLLSYTLFPAAPWLSDVWYRCVLYLANFMVSTLSLPRSRPPFWPGCYKFNILWAKKSSILFSPVTLSFLEQFLWLLYQWKQERILHNMPMLNDLKTS